MQIGPADQLRLGRESLGRQRAREPCDLGPGFARDDERVARDDRVVADLRIPFAAIEDRAAADLTEGLVEERLHGNPGTRHTGHSNMARYATANPRYTIATPRPKTAIGARGRSGVGRASRSITVPSTTSTAMAGRKRE